jgi:hypothetical protein
MQTPDQETEAKVSIVKDMRSWEDIQMDQKQEGRGASTGLIWLRIDASDRIF